MKTKLCSKCGQITTRMVGYCNPCHAAYMRTRPKRPRTPLGVMTAEELARFESKYVRNEVTECWEWTGAKSIGYGVITQRGWLRKASRVAYVHYVGPIPSGLCVCHTCDRPSCVSPSHLFLGTHADNIADKVAKGRHSRGVTHGAHLHPETRCNGDRHWTRTRPDKVTRGEGCYNAVLTAAHVTAARIRHANGEGIAAIAESIGVTRGALARAIYRKTWKHVA